MKKILLLLLFLCCASQVQAEIYSLSNQGSYGSYATNQISDNLLYAERQLFNKTYKRESILDRLERLELAVFGTIQAGSEINRAYNIRKAVTNVASGGNGLQYFTNRMMDLTGNSSFGGMWNFGGNNGLYGFNNHNCGCNNWTNRYHNHYRRHNHGHGSHRVPPCHHASHRLPPPPPCNHNNGNPIINGDYMQNYSLGTSVKILDD